MCQKLIPYLCLFIFAGSLSVLFTCLVNIGMPSKNDDLMNYAAIAGSCGLIISIVSFLYISSLRSYYYVEPAIRQPINNGTALSENDIQLIRDVEQVFTEIEQKYINTNNSSQTDDIPIAILVQ